MSQGFRDRIPRCRIGGSEHRLTTATLSSSGRKCHVGCIVASRVCTGRGLAKWSERERETLSSLSVFVHMLIHALPSRERTHGGKEKEKEEKESVGGSVANHFLPGRVRSSNNRILVRAASEKGCTPLYVRSERTATKKIKERRGEKKEGKEGEGEKKRSKVLLE